MNFVRRDSNALIGRTKGVIENSDPSQMRNIFLQDLKSLRVRFKADNVGVGEPMMKINNRRTDIAPDIDDDFRFETCRHVVLCFRARSEQNLIQSKWIARA